MQAQPSQSNEELEHDLGYFCFFGRSVEGSTAAFKRFSSRIYNSVPSIFAANEPSNCRDKVFSSETTAPDKIALMALASTVLCIIKIKVLFMLCALS